MATTIEEEILEKEYYDPSNPVSYSGARNLVEKFEKNIPKEKINDWLASQDAHTRHRPARRKFPRLHYNVSNIDDVWEADLVELRSLKTYNDGVSFLLVVIDVLSKYLWVEPLKDKSASSVLQGFKNIFNRSNKRTPMLLQTDKGKEFVANTVQDFLKSKNINFRTARNPDVKCAVVERVNRT